MLIQQHTTGCVAGPGVFEMPAHVYHADPAPRPSLSSSIANTLIYETPLHARHQHPRLRPGPAVEETNAAMNKGSVAHELILGKGGGFDVLEFDDWRKKAAQEARDASLAAGRTPILAGAYAEAEEIAQAVIDAVGSTPDCEDFLDPAAQSELVLIWQEDNGVWCRAMIDRLTPRGVIYDVKSSGRGLDTRTLQNRFDDGFDTQPGLYLRGLTKLWPEMAGRFRWRWIFAEQAEPFAVRIDEADGVALKTGAEKAEFAIRKWAHCMATGDWPGYPRLVGRLGPTEWAFNRWSEKLLEEGRALPTERIQPDHIVAGEVSLALPEEV